MPTTAAEPAFAAAPAASPGVLKEVAQGTLAVRLLVVAALIVLNLWLPSGALGRGGSLLLVGAAVLYAFGLALYGARSPDRAEQIARWALPGDVALLWIGMVVTAVPADFVLLGFPLVVVAGLLTGPWGAGAVAAPLVLAQMPVVPVSMFAPTQWVGWSLLAFSLLAVGAAAGAAARRLAVRARFTQALAEIGAAVASGGPSATGPAGAIVRTVVGLFQADSGALALVDPATNRLDVLASHGLDASAVAAGPETGEGIARWVAQGGRAVLLTPGSPFPLRVQSARARSSLCVACAVAGRPIGVLILHRESEGDEFTKGDLDDAEAAVTAATAHLLRVYDERALNATLTALAGGHAKVSYALTRDPVVLWPALLDLARSLTSARFAVLALEHEYTGNVEIVAARGLNGAAARALLPPLIAAITFGQTRSVEGTGPTNGAASSVTCIPLSVGSRTIGALGLDVPEQAPFSPSVVSAVAAHVAAAVDTVRTAQRVADIGAAEERRRIAREMHDGLAQTLANALLQTDLSAMAAQSAPADLGRELRELRSLLEQGIREMREFMAELRRTGESDGRLFLALERLAGELERQHRVAIKVAATGDDAHLPPAVRYAVLAIARQALANAQAHARATSITVRADVTDEACTVTVTDNGIGFDVRAQRDSPDAAHHLGLPSMDERASLVGGRLAIESGPNRGTSVTVHVPLGVRHA